MIYRRSRRTLRANAVLCACARVWKRWTLGLISLKRKTGEKVIRLLHRLPCFGSSYSSIIMLFFDSVLANRLWLCSVSETRRQFRDSFRMEQWLMLKCVRQQNSVQGFKTRCSRRYNNGLIMSYITQHSLTWCIHVWCKSKMNYS